MVESDKKTTEFRAFLVHLALYLAVNAGLAAINLSQTPAAGEPRTLWFFWPLAGWGIGVAAHWLALLLQARTREGGLLADKDVQGVTVHLFVYLAVNALLVVINLVTSPQNLWFIWPLLGWGIGLAAHALLAYRAVMRRTVERYAAEQRVLVEIQLERQAAEIAAAIVPAKADAAPVKRKQARKRAARKKTAPAKKRVSAKKTATKTKTAKRPAGRRAGKQAAKPGPSA